MKLYHRTYFAEAILKEGFKDRTGYYMTNRPWTGVWFSDHVLDPNEGADGDRVLMLEIPEHVIDYYEWIEEDLKTGERTNWGYREWLIPAELVNSYGPPIEVIENEDTLEWEPK